MDGSSGWRGNVTRKVGLDPPYQTRPSDTAQPDNHVDRRHFGAFRNLWQPAYLKLGHRGIGQGGAVFPIEMRVIRHVGIEIALRSINGDLAQKASITKGPKGVVDGRKRYAFATAGRGIEKALSGDMSVLPISDQQSRQGQPLPGWTQTRSRQPKATPLCALCVLDCDLCYHDDKYGPKAPNFNHKRSKLAGCGPDRVRTAGLAPLQPAMIQG